MASQSSGRDPVEVLAEEFAERYRQGERPSLAEYTARHPELADQIRELFPALVEMEQLASVEGPLTAPYATASPGSGAPPAQLGGQGGRGGPRQRATVQGDLPARVAHLRAQVMPVQLDQLLAGEEAEPQEERHGRLAQVIG